MPGPFSAVSGDALFGVSVGLRLARAGLTRGGRLRLALRGGLLVGVVLRLGDTFGRAFLHRLHNGVEVPLGIPAILVAELLLDAEFTERDTHRRRLQASGLNQVVYAVLRLFLRRRLGFGFLGSCFRFPGHFFTPRFRCLSVRSVLNFFTITRSNRSSSIVFLEHRT